jgi:hypothetical protein
MMPKNSLTVQWTVGEVVGVEYAVALHCCLGLHFR